MTQVLPLWIAEGRKELLDNRSVWDWTKYNVRAHAIKYSKKNNNWKIVLVRLQKKPNTTKN